MSQHLTLRQLIADNRRALADGTLAAAQGASICAYAYTGAPWRCAIGVALSDETLASLARSDLLTSGVSTLHHRKMVSYADAEAPYIRTLQDVHDQWVHHPDGFDPDLVEGTWVAPELRDWLRRHEGHPVREFYPAFLNQLEKYCAVPVAP